MTLTSLLEHISNMSISECVIVGIGLGFFLIGLKEISSWFFKAIEDTIFPKPYNSRGLKLRDDVKEIMRKYKETKKKSMS